MNKKVGNSLVLLTKNNSWDSLFGSLDKFTDNFMSERIQPGIDITQTSRHPRQP